MEIKFENKLLGSYREIFHQLRRIQESAESVVPDTNDDIGRIASVHTSVLLKSKDVSSRGVQISGEAAAVLLYITESESAVSFVRVTKPFTVDFEIGDMESDIRPQINLQITNAEARVINPRKVSVTFELSAELSCYRPEVIEADSMLPEDACPGIHLKYELRSAELPNAVCEKTFALNEQFSFPAGKPVPERLVFQKSDFRIEDSQLIGSKIIVKGSLFIDCCYMSQEAEYPVRTRFTAPFSQIIETGEERMDSCSVLIALSSEYYELIDTISGEKALDAELHAVIELVSRRRENIRYISDAYCNTMPAACTIKSLQLPQPSPMQSALLRGEQSITIAEDCRDVLSAFASVSQLNAQEGKLSAALGLDIIYETASGSLSSVRRIINLECGCPEQNIRLISCFISQMDIRPEGESVSCSAALTVSYQSTEGMELSRVTGLELQEEHAYELSSFPALSLVRGDKGELWELARDYHSSPEAIERMNPAEAEDRAGLLLIPREI